MLENNNSRIISRMAKRSLVSNRRRNMIMVAAIMLSSFMLFTILTVGSTYFQMQTLQDIRMNGGDQGAYIYGGFTEKQKKIVQENSQVERIGIEGVGAWAERTDRDDTLHTVFVWADDVAWNQMYEPAREWVKGTYPEKDNEIMTTKEALEDCGYGELGIGDSIEVTYADNHGTHTKQFLITGLWEGFGNKKTFYVSQSFFEQSGFKLEDSGRGFLTIKFKSDIVTSKTLQSIENSLELGKKQHLIIMMDMAYSLQILFGIVGLVLITGLSAYLLIYNILYLSVAGNVRYYGLLQTVGMTGKQVYQFIQRQMRLMGLIGIGGGIMLGAATSFLVIPRVVKALGIKEKDVNIAFNPLILLSSICMVALTIHMGSRKPAKMATEVSPVAALGYRGGAGRKTSRRTRKGNLSWKMAKEQLWKDKKKTIVVLGSLALCLSVFLCLVTLTTSQGPRNIASSFMDADISIANDTVKKENEVDWKQLLDTEFMNSLEQDEAVEAVHPTYQAKIVVPWEPKFADTWIRVFYDMWMAEPYEQYEEQYKQHPEQFYSFMSGIDEEEFRYLNSRLKDPVDEETFLSGKLCIVFQNDLEIDTEMFTGTDLNYYLFGKSDASVSMKIGAFTGEREYAGILGIMPTIIVSESYFKSVVAEPVISKAKIQYKKEYDEVLETRLKDLMEESTYAKDFSFESKIDTMKSIKKAQGNMMGIGAGIIMILALIGIMNYTNTVVGSIQSRQTEIAILESVGMTEKQVKKMLVKEGILFAAGSIFLTATVGMAVTYIVYQAMNYMGVGFAIPVIPIVIMLIVIFLICIIVPLAAYRIIFGKQSIVERIR